MKTWNIGIIGAGLIADFHAKAIESLPNAKLIGICGTNSVKVKNLAGKYSCKAFTSEQEMLMSDQIDMVTITNPSGAHMEPAVEAAAYGKHVLCEKPLDVTLERVDKMIEAHERSGTRLGGIFNYRYNDAVRLLKKTVDSGRFGTISCASVFVPWWRTDDYYKSSWRGTWKLDGGGALINQSIHMVDLLQYMMGPVLASHAFIATPGHPQIEVEDTAVGIVRFKNNALGIVYGTTASFPGQYRRLEITGTKGTVIMEDNSFKMWQFADELEEDKDIREKFGKIEGGGGVSDPGAIPFQPHAKNIAAFLESLENNTPFEIDAYEARKSIEIIVGMYDSARKNK